MVYALAAYTITLGTLVLYLVVMQHRARQLAAARGAATTSDVAVATRGFNLGAMLLAPIWMLRHGLALPGGVVLLATLAAIPLALQGMWLPLLFVAAVPIAAGAALGFVGNRIAAAHAGITDALQLAASQLPWAVAGVILHAFVLPWLWYFATRP